MLKKDDMERKHKPLNPKVLPINIQNGAEWSPGKVVKLPSKHNVPQPEKPVVKIIEDVIIDWFLHENPKADEVHLVKGSLTLADPTHNVWKAKVQTFCYYETIEPRIHESSIRFRVECHKNKNNSGRDFYFIHHNHVIFPS